MERYFEVHVACESIIVPPADIPMALSPHYCECGMIAPLLETVPPTNPFRPRMEL